MKSFLVYMHRRESDGIPFYIGIAKENPSSRTYNRPYDTWKRSKLWKRIASKHGRVVEILYTGKTFGQAVSIESCLIKKYGRINLKTGILANMTDGGEGSKGVPTAKGIDNINSRHIVDARTGEVLYYGYREVAEAKNLKDKHSVGKVMRGKRPITQRKWMLMLEEEYKQLKGMGVDPAEYIDTKGREAIARQRAAGEARLTQESIDKLKRSLRKRWENSSKKDRERPENRGGGNPMARKVVNTETGDVFDSIVEAAAHYGMTRYQMGRRVMGKIEKDKRFKYYED
jgi:hypothetical protein